MNRWRSLILSFGNAVGRGNRSGRTSADCPPAVTRLPAFAFVRWLRQHINFRSLTHWAPLTPLGSARPTTLGRGQDYAAVLTDLAQHRVLEVHAARTQESAEQLLGQALTKEQRAGVAAVCIDMWPPFEAAIGTCLPQARIVYDPFHVVSHSNEALDQVRRAEQRHRLAQGDETLTGSRPLWLHGFERLDRRRRRELRALLTPELKTGLAWALKEQLRDL